MIPEEIYEKACRYLRSHNRDEYLRTTFGEFWFKENPGYGNYILDKAIYDCHNNISKYYFGDYNRVFKRNSVKCYVFTDLQKNYSDLDLYYYMLNGFENNK